MEENNVNYPTTEFGEKYLPVGTIVLLKDAQKRLIIIGYDVRNSANESRDYCGCFFPEGLKDASSLMVFNHDKIDKVYHMGLYDEESEKFFENLAKLVNVRDANAAQQASENSNVAESNANNPYATTAPTANPIPEENTAPNLQQNPPVVAPTPEEPAMEEPVIDDSELEEPVLDDSELGEPSLMEDEPTTDNMTPPNSNPTNMQ